MASDATETGWEARKLLRASRSACLGTVLDGQPFASLVTHACTADLSLLLLLSDLSEHTRHLRADSRCSLLVTGEPTGPNPQTAPRVTVTGLAEIMDDPALKARFLAIHPYAALYADFGDFHIWRIRPVNALLVGGFARAARVRSADLLPDPAAVGALEAAALSIMDHCNTDHADAMARLAGKPGAWRMVGVDGDGCDLAQTDQEQGDQVRRVAWSQPVVSAAGVRDALICLLRDLPTGSD